MGSIVKAVIYGIKDCTIIGVEAGNVNKVSEENSVVAFTLRTDAAGQPGVYQRYKILVKGVLAHTLYNLFLKSGNTVTKTIDEGVVVNKAVTVSLNASLREERGFEIVLENPTDIEFNFNYKIVN